MIAMPEEIVNFSVHKFTGAGNDFVLIDDRENRFSDDWYATITPLLCNRFHGIGGDGLMVLRSSDRFDFRMHYLNSDGSLAGMCGNGARCLSEFFFLLTGTDRARFETRSGEYFAERKGTAQVALSLIKPFDFADVPGQDSETCYVNTGTQHLVVKVSGLDEIPVETDGRKLRYSEFAHSKGGSNVNFIEITGPGSLRIRTYEKGVEGETLACGTGTVAAAFAAFRKGWIAQPIVQVTVKSGSLLTVYLQDRPILEGPADYLFSSHLSLQKNSKGDLSFLHRLP